MHIELPDAIKIYAKMCRARFGSRAARVVRDQVQRLRVKGDRRGVREWERVEDEIRRQQSGEQGRPH